MFGILMKITAYDHRVLYVVASFCQLSTFLQLIVSTCFGVIAF